MLQRSWKRRNDLTWTLALIPQVSSQTCCCGWLHFLFYVGSVSLSLFLPYFCILTHFLAIFFLLCRFWQSFGLEQDSSVCRFDSFLSEILFTQDILASDENSNRYHARVYSIHQATAYVYLTAVLCCAFCPLSLFSWLALPPLFSLLLLCCFCFPFPSALFSVRSAQSSNFCRIILIFLLLLPLSSFD